MVFMLQVLHGRPDLDDLMYREYLRRSRVELVFGGSIAALVATALAYLMLQSTPDQEPLVEVRGLRNPRRISGQSLDTRQSRVRPHIPPATAGAELPEAGPHHRRLLSI